MEIGSKLKEARVQCTMTQEQVAEELQVSRQTISNWENEKSYPDILSVIKLSAVSYTHLDVYKRQVPVIFSALGKAVYPALY